MRFFEEVEQKHLVFPGVETILPKRADKGTACYDFYLKEDVILYPGESKISWSDVKAFFPENEVLLLFVRSSIGIKLGINLSNNTAVIDHSHYGNKTNNGNIGLSLRNVSDKRVELKKGERVCQGLFTCALFTTDDEVLNNERGGGIGSSGKY